MNSIPVLETKLFIPKWPRGLITRPRLTERVRSGVQQRKLTVVSAPAGSGKTTLLAEWLAHRASDLPVAWVSLDTGDNEPAFFWTCVIRALHNIDPAVGHDLLPLLEPGSAPTPQLLTELLNEITETDNDVVLVLDDYHVIDAPAIHTSLAFVLDHLPPRMHVVLATRADPPLPLARMRARGEVIELRTTDLRFIGDEANAFLNTVMTLDLAAADVAALEKRTEGWIAGLKLAALSLQGHENVHEFIHSFAGDNRYVTDYLVEEVLQGQPQHVREFLLATSILERLSAPLCDAVNGGTGSQALLESLEKSNLFVVALDDRREWYRYHHLFAEVLQAHALRSDAARVRELHLRASHWYEQKGAIADAVRHAHDANHAERVAELLERNWPPKDRSYESASWLARVKALPPSLVRARPLLNMGYAWALLNAGELEAAEVQLREVEASPGFHAHDSLPREAAIARVYLSQSRGDFAGSTEHARRVLGLVREDDHTSRATAFALLALGHWADGSLDAAYDTFASALTSMRAAGAVLDAIRGEFVLGDIRAIQGRLREAARIYEAGEATAASHPNAETDELILGLSEVHCERGELQEAERLLHEMEQSMSRAAHKGNRYRWCTAMSRVAAARGNWAEALQLLDEAESCRRRDPLPVVHPLAALKARVRLVLGDVAATSRWATEHNVSDTDDLNFLGEYDHITFARLLVAQNELQRASSFLEHLTAAAHAGARMGAVIEALVLQALVQHTLGNKAKALDAIAQALELAEPEGYVRVFAVEALPMRDLLRQATARGIAGAHTRRVLAAFEETVEPVAAGKSNGAVARPIQRLTDREIEILRLIAAGLRNQEIAAQLFISTATVKRHIANVYNKLEASHRTEALKRAAELSLL